jgi:beta-lactamase class D
MNRRQALICFAAIAAPVRAAADSVTLQETVDGRLARLFADEGTGGAFAAYRADRRQLILSDKARCDAAILPASTFKIPNSIIALETGVVSDPDKDVFKWDGVTRAFPDWNKDHTLRSAIAASAVPVYQEIARRIGAARMKRYVEAFDYGNRDIGGGIDRFWLTGNLRISARQQIAFLDSLRRDALPASMRSQQLARDILPVTTIDGATLRTKTGLVGVDDRSFAGGWRATAGWIVGFAESGPRQTVFALNLDITAKRHIAARMPLAQKALALIGAI